MIPNSSEKTIKDDQAKTVTNAEKDVEVDAGGYIVGQEHPREATYFHDILVANKQYPLPAILHRVRM